MHPFEMFTVAQVEALPLVSRAAYERWFWQWMDGKPFDPTFDIETERREGWL